MNDPESTAPRPAPAGDDATIQLLRSSHPREAVPPEVLERSWHASQRVWRQAVDRRRRHRALWLALGAAAAVALAVSVDLVPTTAKWVDANLFGWARPVAVLEVVVGSASATAGEGGSEVSLARGARLKVGAEVTTDAGVRAAFRLAGGQSLRVDGGSRLRWLSDRVVHLEYGAIYIDSQPALEDDGAVPHPEPIEIRTEYGTATDVGTQFEVRIAEGALRVRVREGRVKLAQGSRSMEAAAGSEWTLHDDGRVSRRSVPAHGEAWRSYLEIAPPFELEGSSLRAFLRWVARETGWRLAYADPAIELSAPGITLHGSPVGVPADQAHDMVLETCGLSAQLEDGILLIDHRPTR